MEQRQEILDKITLLQIELDERLGNYASHGLDLSDEFERIQNNYSGTKECKCAICNGPVVVKSLLPITDEDEVGVICGFCSEGELGPKERKDRLWRK